MIYPNSLQNLIDCFKMLPGIGEKAAERHALWIINNFSVQDANLFAKSLQDCKTKIHHCSNCGNLTEKEECDICKSQSRDHSTICVVESVKDVIALEKSGEYKGIYFVLNGVISPSKGVMPNDLDVDKLESNAANAKEIILATGTTQDGEVTAMYINKLLSSKYPGLLITRIAKGIPTGGSLDYADEMTLSNALSNRKSY